MSGVSRASPHLELSTRVIAKKSRPKQGHVKDIAVGDGLLLSTPVLKKRAENVLMTHFGSK